MWGLVVLFLILCIIFGFWGFAATAVWVGIKVLFWIFLALLILSLVGGLLGGPRRSPLP
jgi:uncharacterized membrane protein YtjA (UPF0391 family)